MSRNSNTQNSLPPLPKKKGGGGGCGSYSDDQINGDKLDRLYFVAKKWGGGLIL